MRGRFLQIAQLTVLLVLVLSGSVAAWKLGLAVLVVSIGLAVWLFGRRSGRQSG